MRRRTIGFAVAACLALAACSGSLAPAGWQPVTGASAAWTMGTGPAVQRYSYEKESFGGTLQELLAREAVDAVKRNRGAKFQSSDIYASCPGVAAVANFSLGRNRALQEGFAVQGGQAVLVTYVRPSGAPVAREAALAMQRALCVRS